ncbi:unnamed protein product [Brachionus calyciflorus]|uniref:Chitin-binding type-4 domain-containing protein n=1 Tax=Brachionus calyciflorus TaxID=104777 RepID=A0A814GX96_9BILA|nr:unnamed protein product [Brachionus calyciflorus]
MKFLNLLLLKFFLICVKYHGIESHGRLLDPPARSSCWREFPNNCYHDYTDNELFCGGASVQWNHNGGKCGICGDNWSGEKNYERNGRRYTGHIVRSYTMGQTIDVKVELTANHLGWFEFKLCNADDLYAQGLDANHDCLNKNLLKDTNG